MMKENVRSTLMVAHSGLFLISIFILFEVAFADQCSTLCGLNCGSLYKCTVSDTQCKCELNTGKVAGIALGAIGFVTICGWITKKTRETDS
jgi:hypothetical protein